MIDQVFHRPPCAVCPHSDLPRSGVDEFIHRRSVRKPNSTHDDIERRSTGLHGLLERFFVLSIRLYRDLKQRFCSVSAFQPCFCRADVFCANIPRTIAEANCLSLSLKGAFDF